MVEFKGWFKKYRKWCDWEDLISAKLEELVIEEWTNPEDMV